MVRKSYPGDLTNKEWVEIEPLISKSIYRGAGCRGKYSRREKLNAILYVLRTGCQWSDLPHDFPPWKTVYSQFLRWRDRGVFEQINTALSRRLRVLMGKNEDPSAGIVDSQSVKTTEKKGSAGLMEARKLRVGKDTYWLITLDS
jgi:putative transposase